MRVVKFCKRNVSRGLSSKAVNVLQQQYGNEVHVRVVDCFKRCLVCRVNPYCRIQLTTIDAPDSDTLVEEILKFVRSFPDEQNSSIQPSP